MKELRFIIIVFISNLWIWNVEAQDSISKDNGSIIKLELLYGGLHYNKRISKNSSACIIVTYDWRYFLNNDNYNFQVSPEYRYHFSKNNPWPQGFYLGSYLFYKDFIVARDMESNSSVVYSKDEVTTAGIGIKPGYHYVFSKSGIWVIDFGLGFGYNLYRDIDNITGVPILDESRYYFNFTGNFAVGLTF